MYLAFVIFSVKPGGLSQVKRPLVTAALTLFAPSEQAIFATEIGEVNTLMCVFHTPDLSPDLQTVNTLVKTIQTSEAGSLLNSVLVDVFVSDGLVQLAQLDAKNTPFVLLQKMSFTSISLAKNAVALRSFTGRQAQYWVLTPLSNGDEALKLNIEALNNPDCALKDSTLLEPVRKD